jgi:hypothetical protein
MGAKRPPTQKLTPEQRAEARAERERRRLHDAVDRLLASRVAQGFPAKVEDPTVLARIAAILLEHEREQRSRGAVDD